MMKRLFERIAMLALVAGLVIGGTGVARANLGPTGVGTADGDPYAFGFSGGVAQTLTLTLSDSSTLVLNTGQGAINGNNQGWWSNLAGNYNTNDNYFVGDVGGSPHYHDYFTFLVNGISPLSVTAATLNLYTYTVSTASPLNYQLWDVSTDAATLANKVAGPSVPIFTDLGTGVNYGGIVINPSDSGITINIGLNAAALTDLNAALTGQSGYFSIGGAIATTAVPEPSTLAIAGLGGIFFVAYARRRKV